MVLSGMTSSEKANIDLDLGNNKWIWLFKLAVGTENFHQPQKHRRFNRAFI
jgi:hypothetical protein